MKDKKLIALLFASVFCSGTVGWAASQGPGSADKSKTDKAAVSVPEDNQEATDSEDLFGVDESDPFGDGFAEELDDGMPMPPHPRMGFGGPQFNPPPYGASVGPAGAGGGGSAACPEGDRRGLGPQMGPGAAGKGNPGPQAFGMHRALPPGAGYGGRFNPDPEQMDAMMAQAEEAAALREAMSDELAARIDAYEGTITADVLRDIRKSVASEYSGELKALKEARAQMRAQMPGPGMRPPVPEQLKELGQQMRDLRDQMEAARIQMRRDFRKALTLKNESERQKAMADVRKNFAEAQKVRREALMELRKKMGEQAGPMLPPPPRRPRAPQAPKSE